MSGTRELSRRVGTRTDATRPVAPIMIQVPSLRPGPLYSTSQSRPKPRRRLRREVRWTGMLLLPALTLWLGFLAGTRSRDGVMANPAGSVEAVTLAPKSAPFLAEIPAAPAAPAVTLSIEPIATIAARPEPVREIPTARAVELESTLLPVDGSEDPPYEGR